MKTINSVFDFVQQNYVEELDPKILYEGALKGMLNAIGDPYTLYLDADAMRDLTDTTEGAFEKHIPVILVHAYRTSCYICAGKRDFSTRGVGLCKSDSDAHSRRGAL